MSMRHRNRRHDQTTRCMSKSPRAIAQIALEIGQAALPPYANYRRDRVGSPPYQSVLRGPHGLPPLPTPTLAESDRGRGGPDALDRWRHDRVGPLAGLAPVACYRAASGKADTVGSDY